MSTWIYLRVLLGLEVEADSEATARPLVKQVLVDALGEFIAARTPVDAYVARRYAEQSEHFREGKRQEVAERVNAAIELHKAAHAGNYDCG